MPAPELPSLDCATIIAAPATRILRAFFDAPAMKEWWDVSQAVVTPRPLGAYAVQWAPTDFRDEVLGTLGGVFYGTVIDIDLQKGFFIADAYWLPPEGDPIGPMAMNVTCEPVALPNASATKVRVRQTGYEDSARWRRYYEVVGRGWDMSLAALKRQLEQVDR